MKEGFETMFVPGVASAEMPRGDVLVLAPHPDDEILGCGGAIIRHADNGDAVHVIVATDGRYGDPELTPASCGPDYPDKVDAYVALRQRESRAAGQLAGYTPSFWGIPDRGLEYGERAVRTLLEEIQRRAPTLVYAPSLHEMHPDHRALAMIAVEAVRRSDPDVILVMYEVARQIPSPNVLLDITDLVDRKRKAAQCFQSQLAVRPFDEYAALNDRMRTVTLPLSVLAAEAYLSVRGEELRSSLPELFESEYQRQRRMGLTVDAGNAPKVSVIVRAIDRPELRREALDSIALQTHPNIEVVLIDAVGDGSLVSEEWCGRFPIVFCSEGKPLERGRAANLGLDRSTGDFLIFLDDDDWFEPDHVATLVAAAADHPEARVFHAGVRGVDSHGVDNGKRFNSAVDPLALLTGNIVPIHAVLFEKSLLDEGCRFDETLALYEDWDFWIQVSNHAAFHRVDHVGAAYRIHDYKTSGAWRPEEAERGRSALLQKWRSRMTDEQFERLMAYAAVGMSASGAPRREAELAVQEKALARSAGSRTHRLFERLMAPVRGAASLLGRR